MQSNHYLSIKMQIFSSYNNLASSSLFDKLIFKIFKRSTLAMIILFLNNFLSSFIPISILILRQSIDDIYIKRAINWTSIGWLFISGNYQWLQIFIIIEFLRELFIALPFIIISLNLNGSSETLLKRLIRLYNDDGVVLTKLLSLYHTLSRYRLGDETEQLTTEERARLLDCITSAEIVIDRLNVYFVLRDSVLELKGERIEIERVEENCDLCKRPGKVKLKCKHAYCFTCIPMWFTGCKLD